MAPLDGLGMEASIGLHPSRRGRYRPIVSTLSDVASLATAAGTLVLAVATFSSVRSANRAAKAAERSLLAGIRPVLAPTRFQDPEQKIGWIDDHWTRLAGGHAGVECVDDVIYLTMGLRNVGAGMAVLHGWMAYPDRDPGRAPVDAGAVRRLSRDLYVPAGDLGFWQGALRDPAEPLFAAMDEAIHARRRFEVDLLYGDQEGGQRVITRFGLLPAGDDAWISAVSRHWNLDRDDPR
jgi:hypothetical protein